MRPTIRISNAGLPSQVVVLRRRGHTGDRLPRLRRQVFHRDRGRLVQDIVLRRRLLDWRERSPGFATVALTVEGAAQSIGPTLGDVPIGIGPGASGIGVAIPTDRTQAIGAARRLAHGVQHTHRPTQWIERRERSRRAAVAVGIHPGRLTGQRERLTAEDGMCRVVVEREADNGMRSIGGGRLLLDRSS